MDTNTVKTLVQTIDYTGIGVLFGALAAFVVAIGGFALQIAIFVRAGNTAANVQKIEVATNSMKDALVKSTREQSLLEGADIERKEAIIRSKEETK